MGRCGCSSGDVVAGCACGFVDSDCIAIIGTGAADNEFQISPILDPADTNILSCGPDGLTAEVPDSILGPPMGRIRRTATQAISSGILTQILFTETDSYDTDGMHAAGSGDVVAVTPGVYTVKTTVIWEGDAAGTRLAQVLRSGGGDFVRDQDSEPGAATGNTLHLADDMELAIGQFFGVYVTQNTGTPLNVDAVICSFRYVGPTP